MAIRLAMYLGFRRLTSLANQYNVASTVSPMDLMKADTMLVLITAVVTLIWRKVCQHIECCWLIATYGTRVPQWMHCRASPDALSDGANASFGDVCVLWTWPSPSG